MKKPLAVAIVLLSSAVSYAGIRSSADKIVADAALEPRTFTAAPKHVGAAWVAAPLVLHLADAIATDIKVHSQHAIPGGTIVGRERNVLLQDVVKDRLMWYTLKAGLGIISSAYVHHLAVNGHADQAKAASALLSSLPAAALVVTESN